MTADQRAALVEKMARAIELAITVEPEWYLEHLLIEDAAAAALAAYEQHMAKPTHKHWKGGIYRVIGSAKIEADLSPVIIYQGSNGTLWVRPEKEFHERFTMLATATAHKEPQT